MPGYLLTFFQKIESPLVMTSVFPAEDNAAACEIAQQTLHDNRASSGVLYRYQQTLQRGQLVELGHVDLESSSCGVPVSR